MWDFSVFVISYGCSWISYDCAGCVCDQELLLLLLLLLLALARRRQRPGPRRTVVSYYL